MKVRLPAPIPVDLSAAAGVVPPVELPYQSDAYQYDTTGGTGSVTGGTILSGPTQDSPTGSIAGGVVLPSDTMYD